MAEFPGAIDCFVDESRVWTDQNDHAAIVLHCTASANPDQTDVQLGNYFETNVARVSTHYGIDRSGNIAQYVLEKDGAGGNGILDPGHDPFWDQYSDNPNWHSLSVECENDINNSLPLANPQKDTLFSLVKYWIEKYNIPLSHIKGHFSLEPVERHDCPGPLFPWDDLFSFLQGGAMATKIPAGWSDNGKDTLTAPNGVKVVLGFREFILDSKNNWNPDDYPLRPQYHANPLEHSNPGEGEGDALDCYLTRLGYTREKGVFKTWLGQELVWLMGQQSKPIPASVQTDIDTLITAANKLKADLA